MQENLPTSLHQILILRIWNAICDIQNEMKPAACRVMERIKFLAEKFVWKEKIADEWNDWFDENILPFVVLQRSRFQMKIWSRLMLVEQTSWKNFSLIRLLLFVVRKRKQPVWFVTQRLFVSRLFSSFIGDSNRAEKRCAISHNAFTVQGMENLLIGLVDASLVAQNILLAAESLGYGGSSLAWFLCFLRKYRAV